MAYRTEYEYAVEMAYIDKDGDAHIILPESIQYIVIDKDYDKYSMPLVYCSIKLDADIYNAMYNAQGNGMVMLRISDVQKSGTSKAPKTYLSEQFQYYMTDKPNPTQATDKLVSGQGVAFKTCILGLIKPDLVKRNQKQFNTVYRDTNTVTIVQNALLDQTLVMQPFTNNVNIKEFPVPPQSTVMRFIDYVNSRYTFYNSPYLYFMDFDKTYLKANDGMYLDAKDGQFPYIAFSIRDLSVLTKNLAGVVIDDKQKAYIIYVDKKSVRTFTDRNTSQIAGTIASVDENGSIKETDLSSLQGITNIDTNLDSKIYVSSKTNENVGQSATVGLQTNTVTVTIMKAGLDASIFTPNKQFIISTFENNDQYTGRYYMASQKVLLENTGTAFQSAIYFGLKLILHY